MGKPALSEIESSATATPPVALTVAGTDSGGSAGVAADVKSFAANGVHGVFAVTLVTAQNSLGIIEAEPVAPTLLAAQIDALTSDFSIAASKTGMLFTNEAVAVVAERAHQLGPLVVDPVLVSAAGTPLFDASMARSYVDQLFPRSTLITPNVAEAELLTGRVINTRRDLLEAASCLLDLGSSAALVTGFHDSNVAVDVFAVDGQVTALEHDLIDTQNVLGTGCSLSATIAARLAWGDELGQAIDHARAYVLDGLRSGARWRLGSGRGPIDHLARWPGLR